MLRILFVGAVLFIASPAFSQTLPEGPGRSTVEQACAACHALSNITRAGHSKEEWNTVLHMMVNAGAQVPPDQFAVVADYLAKMQQVLAPVVGADPLPEKGQIQLELSKTPRIELMYDPFETGEAQQFAGPQKH